MWCCYDSEIGVKYWEMKGYAKWHAFLGQQLILHLQGNEIKEVYRKTMN
jgi:hypothetical protein